MTAETRGTPPPSQPLDLRTVIDAIPAEVVSAPDGCVEFVNQGWRESPATDDRREILNPVVYSGAGGFEESAGAFARAAVLKDGAARHEDLGASAHDVCDCVVMDAAVYFNAKIEPARLAELRDRKSTPLNSTHQLI